MSRRRDARDMPRLTGEEAEGHLALAFLSAEPGSTERLVPREKLRVLEALLFAAAEPLDVKTLSAHFGPEDDVPGLLVTLQEEYRGRGVHLVRLAGKWAFRTAEDLSYLLRRERTEERKLSRAALETLAIIAYHQPVTRAEIEEIRGVATSKGTLDVLLETGWVRMRGRRRAPGRPVTYGTTDGFLVQFGFDQVSDLPGLAELKGAGLLDGHLPPGFSVPEPRDLAKLQPDELPLDELDAAAEETEAASGGGADEEAGDEAAEEDGRSEAAE
ncbi:MAG: SMC-Scp complex subunit ScpB [Hyphomicrobiaceae bacterium]